MDTRPIRTNVLSRPTNAGRRTGERLQLQLPQHGEIFLRPALANLAIHNSNDNNRKPPRNIRPEKQRTVGWATFLPIIKLDNKFSKKDKNSALPQFIALSCHTHKCIIESTAAQRKGTIMAAERNLKTAVLWHELPDKRVRCYLCDWRCKISNGKRGHCGVRQNFNGTLYSLNYNRVCAANPDPIEKKPLFHFQPGTKSYSISTPGCNFRCNFCQNWQISQMALEDNVLEGRPIPPEEIVADALATGCSSIAYTYTEPTVFMELCADTGRIAKQKGLANVFVSNGYMTLEAIDYAADFLDAINIDLKAFTEKYYMDLCKAHLSPVLDTIRHIANETDIWLELTTLIIPGQNDSDDELRSIADFIANEVSPFVPWHISRFYPTYHMNQDVPTPAETLQRALDIGKAAGLKYVYVGNLPGSKAESTSCHHCDELLIERIGYQITKYRIEDAACPKCKTTIPGRFP